MINKALLLILDGWGVSTGNEHDAIAMAKPEYWLSLNKKFPHTELHAKEEAVGLPNGCLSGSEVGHITIGAGRIIWQQVAKIDRSIDDGTIMANSVLSRVANHLKKTNGKLHIVGLLSDGGIHSHYKHLVALMSWAKDKQFNHTSLHLFLDGRDMAPMSGLELWNNQIKPNLSENITLSTICGRATGMDRGEKWERTAETWNLFVENGEIEKESFEIFLERQYQNKITDEFVAPTRFDDKIVAEGDAIIYFNFRADRMRQMVRICTKKAPHNVQEKIKIPKDLFLASLTEYDTDFLDVKVMYQPEFPINTLGEWVSKHGLKQFRIAESEKYAHVTYFLNGGREEVFPGEERLVIPSLGLTNYASHPEMSLPEVTSSLLRVLAGENHELVVCNIANGDMVGHSGDMDAGIKAVKEVDKALERIIPIATKHGYTVFITADHGNIEQMRLNDEPHTAHTFNHVPFLITDKKYTLPKQGELNQIAPTILKIMGLEKPNEMTSESMV